MIAPLCRREQGAQGEMMKGAGSLDHPNRASVFVDNVYFLFSNVHNFIKYFTIFYITTVTLLQLSMYNNQNYIFNKCIYRNKLSKTILRHSYIL